LFAGIPESSYFNLKSNKQERDMMKLTAGLLTVIVMTAATPALAEGEKFAGYVIKAKTEVVDGVMLVNGYTPSEVMSFLREDCASGQVGQMTYVGKPYKRRGHTFQKFQTTCTGGPSPRIGQTSEVAVDVERMPDGRNMTEYTFGVNGEIKYVRYIR
jgi:hypothetical protein